ncbi:Calmodulin-dependent protein kinase cmk2 [Rhodotorula kratochvilovae]
MGILEHLGTQPESYKKKKQYRFETVLGTGAFGEVKQATWTPPPGNSHYDDAQKVGGQIEVAVKVIRKKALKGDLQAVIDEVEVLTGLNHPNVVKLYDSFESKEKFYLAFQLASGGELFEKISSRGKFTEGDAANVIIHVLEGVKYLHDHNIVHRDIKPENLLYTKPNSDQLVIADFGIAKHVDNDESLTSLAGSPGYAAPEVLLKKGHGKPVDLWSIGVVTYTLLCGYIPFRATETQQLLEECKAAKLEFHDRYWKNISEDAKAFIRALIQPNPEDRPTAEQALKHKWLVDAAKKLHEHDLSTDFKANWTPSRRWKNTINTLIATRRFQQAADKARGTTSTPSSSDSSLQASPVADAPRESVSTDGGGYHTADDDDEALHEEIRRRDAEHAGIRERELGARSSERARGEARTSGEHDRERDFEQVSQGLESLQVRA